MAGGGDTKYGNGVYLTKLNPETTSKEQIAMNNWTNSNAIHKVDKYFVIDIPESEVKNTNARGRNIFLYERRMDLRLHKYTWWLKDFDSNQILASYKYQMASLGPASEMHPKRMGVYTMTEDTVNGRPMYQSKGNFLFMDTNGQWGVGPDVGSDDFWLVQCSDHSLGPDQEMLWEYTDISTENLAWREDDATLKASAFQTNSMSKIEQLETEIKELREKFAVMESSQDAFKGVAHLDQIDD